MYECLTICYEAAAMGQLCQGMGSRHIGVENAWSCVRAAGD